MESRRGGGGYIRITRVRLDRSSALMHLINTVGERMDAAAARAVLDNCIHSGLIEPGVGSAMLGAISSSALREVPTPFRDRVRAAVLKQMLVTQI